MVEQLDPTAADTFLDPSCGDGEFLLGAAAYLVETGLVHDARELARRLIGFDVNPGAVAEARQRLSARIRERLGADVPPEVLRLHCEDALRFPDRESLEARLGALPGRLLITGNPPYVEAKRLSAATKAELKRRFPSAASGAPDLYLYFLHACLDWLRPGDRLALVLPNRVLVNSNGRALRERMLDRGQLWRLDFATRTQIFPGAAVYPVVLYASGGAEPDAEVGLASIARNGVGLQRTTLPGLPAQTYASTRARAIFPTPPSPLLTHTLRNLLEALPAGRIADVLDIRWTVSFHRQGLREQYVRRSKEEMRFPQKFLGGGTFAGNGDVERYRAQWSGWWIDYDTELLKREGNVLPPLELFQRPKIAICQNGRTVRAAFLEQEYVLKDTLLAGLLRESEHPFARHPRALVALLSSRLVHFYYSHVFHGGHVNGGYLHFLRSFLDDIPLGHWTEEAALEAAALVEEREHLEPGAVAEPLEERLEAVIAGAFDLEERQVEALREWSDADENWCARNRVRRRAPETGLA